MYCLQHGCRAAIGIHRAVDPGVAMIAADHPLFGILRTRYRSDHIPDGAVLEVLLKIHLHAHWTWSDVIREWKRTLPFARRFRSSKVGENGLSVSIRDGCSGNFREALHLIERK